MTAVAVIIFIVVVGVAGKIALDGMFLSAAREFMRSRPDARQAFIAGGGWARFSRRFGLPYAIALIVGGLAWIVVFANLVPDTDIGTLILFGPSIVMTILGVVLGALWAARLVVDL
jgi:hypothetical protein